MVQEKLIELTGTLRLTSGQLRINNQVEERQCQTFWKHKIRVTKEGLHKINTDGLTLSGRDASNYTLLGEAHEFLFELRAKFKAIKNIENKINELAKSGKKIITGATQAVPKVVAMTTSPSSGPSRSPSLGGGPTGGGGSGTGRSVSSGGRSSAWGWWRKLRRRFR